MPHRTEKVFLHAQWKHLAMLNYEVEPSLLSPLIPSGTELDNWNATTYLSVVGFLFLRTRVYGIPLPFHRNFEEVNLRFYVKRKSDEGWRRGVVFVKELVPGRATAFLARVLYNENYAALPMKHRIDSDSVLYAWKFRGEENHLRVAGLGDPVIPKQGSKEEFIAEHYWGYAKQKDGTTMEYHVEHPRWKVRNAAEAALKCDGKNLYGERFVEALRDAPDFSFVAEGSEVKVYKGQKI